MMHVKRVPFEKLGDYLQADRRIAVVKDGRVVGIYEPRIRAPMPSSGSHAEPSRVPGKSLDRFDQILQGIFDQTGMTEDEWAEYMDPTLGCICDECANDDL